MELIDNVYTYAEAFPKTEKYGLSSQIQDLLFQFLQILQKEHLEIQKRILQGFWK